MLAVVFEHLSETYCYDPKCAVFDSLDKVLGEELLDDMREHLVWFWTLCVW
jgi:hypothetical protein